MYVNLDRYLIFMLVLLRMTGMYVLNPIFARQNVPVMVNAGLSFLTAICVVTVASPWPMQAAAVLM